MLYMRRVQVSSNKKGDVKMRVEELKNAVEAFGDKAGITINFEPEKRAFYARYIMDGKHFRFIISYDGDEIMLFFWMDGVRADMGSDTELLRFLNMVNWDIKSGKMTMDPENGEIRFDNYLKVEEGCNLENALENIMLLSIFTLERYYSAILPLSLGFSSAETEMAKLQKKSVREQRKPDFIKNMEE